MINWKDPRIELPPLDKSYRCLAKIIRNHCSGSWSGYCDVYFTAVEGWKRCETNESCMIKKWVLMDEIENDTK